MSIASLSARFGLDAAAQHKLIVLARDLVEDDAAPTTLRTPADVERDHLADSLVALELPVWGDAASVADLGSGAGLPGLALAAARPSLRVHLVESTGRKCEFLAAAASRAGIGNVEIVRCRIEEWAPEAGNMDVITARALAPLPVVLEYAAPLLRPEGVLVAWRGAVEEPEQAQALRAASELGLSLDPPLRVVPYPGVRNRHLQLARKTGPTPIRFPRRSGMARKYPLGREVHRPPSRPPSPT